MSASLPPTRTRVGKYELGKTLGEGTFAKVKFAKNIDTGDGVAIKIIDRDHVLRHKMVEQDEFGVPFTTKFLSNVRRCFRKEKQIKGEYPFSYRIAPTVINQACCALFLFFWQIKREISTMKLIKHPNVLKLFEVVASKTKIYIVLEYVDGGELFDKIAKYGRLKEDEARRYFQQLINAVDYCHSRGVYHRDLKPENLLLDSYGVLKISDFGLSAFSKQVREDGLLHTACGTPNYVAPEVLTDKGYDGTASDIWSCGVILFVLMAGYLPFDEPNLMALYRKICKADFSFPPWFSSSSKKLIRLILDPNPLSRMTIPEILENDWFKKGYQPPQFDQEQDVSLDDVDAVFNDSKGLVKRETRFTSKCPANEIMSKIEETAKPLGFNVHKKNYKMKLKGDKTGRKGQLSVATEVFEVAPSLHMVELRKTGGDTLEFHKFYKNFSSGLKDVVWTTEQHSD